MNERIRLLAEQAGAVFEKTNGLNDCPQDSLVGNEIEKFAELIVEECVSICQDVDGEDNIDARSGRQDCAVEIREHFGVEDV